MFNEAQIRDVAASAIQEDVIAVRKIYAGGMNFVFELILKQRSLMLKAYPPARIHAAISEYNILIAARSAGVIVPQAMMCGTEDEFGYLIYASVEGSNLNFDMLGETEQFQVSQSIIENIWSLTNVTFTYFGSVTDDENKFSTWGGFLTDCIESGEQALASTGHLASSQLHTMVKYMTTHRLLSMPCKPALVWGDPKSENILMTNNQLSALLDFESCFSGDPLLSLGYLFAREGDSSLYKELSAKFNKLIPFTADDIYFYALLRLMRISKYLNTVLPTGKKRLPVLSYFPGIQKSLNRINSQHG
ncbi:phosphotransferase [Mucilaginibacter sp. ZT4R22]|uniref:Phosphotransferase n=1 Tax=Mucilaginibacter pankratovii TaxID=2772110 RepID=A0ABR7WVS4_9SPHI|nr:phosphotransferase [Mucilaginibacter pankratovii]MBD1365357.1 phosphotransferase [Mucilaginibacter pankratovii]